MISKHSDELPSGHGLTTKDYIVEYKIYFIISFICYSITTLIFMNELICCSKWRKFLSVLYDIDTLFFDNSLKRSPDKQICIRATLTYVRVVIIEGLFWRRSSGLQPGTELLWCLLWLSGSPVDCSIPTPLLCTAETPVR